VKAYTSSELDKIFFHLPNDLKTKGKYLIEKNYVLKAIAKFIFEKRRYERLSDEVIFGAISSVKWENDFDYWKQYNAVQTKTGNLAFGDNGTQSTRAIYDTLDAQLPSLFTE
jgi:hypothetical protein